MTDSVKYLLDESQIPKYWYNIMADLPKPPPPVLHPGTLQPLGPDDLAPLFPMSLIMQEVSTEREVEIPQPVREVYRQWRPSPLYRARRLEKALQTPARIYYKYEGVSPAGSHKPNTAVAQAFYNKEAGVKKITTETGAGQWGSSLAFAGALFGLEIQVFMVKVSYNQKPYRRALMETYGARCIPSPSMETETGRRILAASTRQQRQPGHRHLRGGGDCRPARRHQVRAGLGAQPRAAAPDGGRAGGDEAAGDGRRLPRRHRRLHRRRLQLRRHRVPVPRAASCAAARRCASWRWSRPPARASRAASTPTTSATPATSRRWSRCTRWARPSYRRASTPGGCAITAWRRWCPTSRTSA